MLLVGTAYGPLHCAGSTLSFNILLEDRHRYFNITDITCTYLGVNS